MNDRKPESTPGGSAWRLGLALVCFALAGLLVTLRYRPPAPVPEGAPAGEFSAARAGLALRELIGDGEPRPVGSAAVARCRERISGAFRRLGYEPEIQAGSACHWVGNCATIQNVLVRLAGREPGPAVLLAAHYDSVGAGAGASDDLAGVAALLEMARALKAGPPPRHGIWFLADGGEEGGLFGAKVFVRSPAAHGVAAAINLEARGTAGPALMFQTNRYNAQVVRLFARSGRRPVTSSLFSAIYEHLPNDTDFTEFLAAGWQGFNFAFIGDAQRYHTPLDDLTNVSLGSLQQEGENALAAARAMAAADLAAPPRGRAVFFDFLALRIFWWPEGWSLALAALALALLAAASGLLVRQGRLRWPELALGLLAWLAAAVAAGLAAFALLLVVRALGGLAANWLAEPRPLLAALWLLPLATASGVARLFARRAGETGLWAGVWMGWSLSGLAVSLLLPGASYLFLVPVLAAAGTALLLLPRGAERGVATAAILLPAGLAACLWFPVGKLLYDGLGTGGLSAIAVLVSLPWTTLMPLLVGAERLHRRLPLATAALVLLAAGWSLAFSPVSPRSPGKVSLVYHESADAGSARWLVRSNLPAAPSLRRLLRLSPQPFYPWSPDESIEGAATQPLRLPAPEMVKTGEQVEGEERRLRFRLLSHRGALIVGLALPRAAQVEAVTVGGVGLPRRPDGVFAFHAGWLVVSDLTVPPEGVTVDLLLHARHAVTGYVFDRTPGLPSGGSALTAERGAGAVSAGDVTVVSRRVTVE